MHDFADSSRLHTDDFALGPFKPHGHIELWKEGAVVRLMAEGPFNAESIEALGVAMKQLFTETPPKGRFVDIMEFGGSMLGTPDAVVALDNFLTAMSDANTTPVAVAYVAGAKVEGRRVMLPIFKRLYAKHQRPFELFEDRTKAEAWVRERLAGEATEH